MRYKSITCAYEPHTHMGACFFSATIRFRNFYHREMEGKRTHNIRAFNVKYFGIWNLFLFMICDRNKISLRAEHPHFICVFFCHLARDSSSFFCRPLIQCIVAVIVHMFCEWPLCSQSIDFCSTRS